MSARPCVGTNKEGQPCGGFAVEDDDFCFLHSPKHAEEAKRAQALGGQVRRREDSLGLAYDLEAPASLEGIIRTYVIGLYDILSIPNAEKRGPELIKATVRGRHLHAYTDLREKMDEILEQLREQGSP